MRNLKERCTFVKTAALSIVVAAAEGMIAPDIVESVRPSALIFFQLFLAP